MNSTSCLSLFFASVLSVGAQTAAPGAATPATTAPAPSAPAWKKIPLGGEQGPSLSLGGRLRARTEHWENFGMAAANDDDFQLYRAFLNADLKLSPAFRVFIEAKSATGDGRDLPGGNRDIDTDTLDLQQAFVEFTAKVGDNATLSLAPGRQELLYGKQRLISPLDWVNTRRTFDAVKASYKQGDLKIDAFASRLVMVDRHDFNNEDSGQNFHGVYATQKMNDSLSCDAYALFLDKDVAKFGNSTNDENRVTLGLRCWGKPKETSFDYDVEAAYQTGEFGDQDIGAWMVASEAGYAPSFCPLHSRWYVGYDYASGDEDPTDGDLGTFNQLFPLGHAFFGFIDLIGRQNVQSYNVGVSAKPVPCVTVRIDGQIFERAENTDAVYNAGGGVSRAGASDECSIGREIDLLVKWDANKRTSVLVGFSRFFAGDFAEDTGAHEDVDFAYGSVELSF